MVSKDIEKLLHATFTTTNLQLNQERYADLIVLDRKVQTLSAWRNDVVHSQISVLSRDGAVKGLKANLSQLSGEAGVIPKAHVSVSFVKSVCAFSGQPGFGSKNRPLPIGKREEANEVLEKKESTNLNAQSVQNIWLSISLPRDARPGPYRMTIEVVAEGAEGNIPLTLNVDISDVALPDPKDYRNYFDIELWQNPFAVAEYYGVPAFSKKHLEILKPHMEKYQAIGGHAITATIVEEAWGGQTYSKHAIKYPSMIKWVRKKAGDFEFDYTWFDTWISFNKKLGLGDKIICYSLAPWSNQISYFDEEPAKRKTLNLSAEEASYNEAWLIFLKDFVHHLEEKKWLDHTFIGIDERGFSPGPFALLESIRGKNGEQLKVSGAMDNIVENEAYVPKVAALSIGTMAVKACPGKFETMRRYREDAKLMTTLYSCTGHIPGNFSLSAPGESYWTIMFAFSSGADGFVRWAYDSWVEDPLADTTHNAFEAGDCFLIFPDKKKSLHPQSQSSTRLEKLAEGVRDVIKLQILSEEFGLAAEVARLMQLIKPSYESGCYYLTENGKGTISEDMTELKKEIDNLTLKALLQKV